MKLEKSDLQLETIVSRINNLELDLQPDFQRGEIWDKKRKQRLIDTVLREWYVPAVHIVKDSDGREVVLDGQQRLASIRDFMDDDVTVDGTIEPHDDLIASFHGMRFSQLPEATRRAIRRFVVSVVTLYEYRPEEPNELFFRLNQSYNLTPPEKRNALHGPARDQVKRVVADLTEIGLLQQKKIGFSNGRLAYDDIVSRAAVAIEKNDITRHINNGTVEDFYRSKMFSESTLDSLFDAGRWLLDEIDSTSTGKIRFNKGTLQSWLVYLHWATTLDTVPAGLLDNFETDRQRRRNGATGDGLERQILDVVGIYDDRASYRVTDVSSVQARDLAIHLYSLFKFATPSTNNSELLLASILDSSGDLQSTSQLFFDFISASGWGSQLISEKSA